MTEATLLKLLDLALTAAAVGVEREAILAKVAEKQAAGATPDEIATEIERMRDEALGRARATLQ